jgi:homoprotocatechuate degradation regulator HpaR
MFYNLEVNMLVVNGGGQQAACRAAGAMHPIQSGIGIMGKPLKHRNLALLLLQARECVMVNFRRILNHHGLTEQQWRVMRAISDNGEPMEQWQICATCHILSPSLAGMLARMEEMQLVDRNRVDTDQRRILVALTPSSRALIRAIAPLVEQQYANLEVGLGEDTVRNLYDALDRFLANRQSNIEQVTLSATARRDVARKSKRK